MVYWGTQTKVASDVQIIIDPYMLINPSRLDRKRREKKCGVSKGFMKALKNFIKPFEAPKSVKNLS